MEHDLKIAYLSTFYPYRGGIAQFNANLFNSLSNYATVKAFNFKRQYPNLLFPGQSQYCSPEDKAEKIQSIRSLDTINPLTYWTTYRKIKQFSPDIVITKYWMPFFALPLGCVLQKTKKQAFNITILDNVLPHESQPFTKTLTKFFLNQNHLFVVMSRKVLEDLLSLRPNSNYLLLEHPLYNNFGEKIEREKALSLLQLPQDNFYLLFFGFIREYKGLDLLIEAMQHLSENIHLIVAGEPYVSFEKYERQIDDLGLNDRIHLFVRYIKDEEVPLFFSCADVCVLPYKSATQSGIIAISYHFDLPVIATRTGGLAEMIEPYHSGLVADDISPKGIAEQVSKYLQFGKDRFIQGIQKYKEVANWNFFAKKIIESYHSFKLSDRTTHNVV